MKRANNKWKIMHIALKLTCCIKYTIDQMYVIYNEKGSILKTRKKKGYPQIL